MRISLAVATLALVAAASVAGPPDLTKTKSAPEPTASNFERLRDAVLPERSELVWKQLGWHVSLWDAVIEAQAKDKPILLWAMNGHPLGCT